jgi:hypothetical protein
VLQLYFTILLYTDKIINGSFANFNEIVSSGGISLGSNAISLGSKDKRRKEEKKKRRKERKKHF